MKERRNKLFRASSILFILNILASALNYICQLMMARVLSVDAFGTINTIFSFMMIMAVPGTTLTMIVAKYYAGLKANTENEERKSYLRRQLKSVSCLAIVVLIVLFLLQIPLGSILLIDDKIVLIMMFILCSLGFYQPLYSGVFSGNRYFIAVGVYSLLIPLYKIVSVAIAYTLTKSDFMRLYIVLFVMIAGTLFTVVAGHWKTNRILGKLEVLKKEKIGNLFSKEDVNTLILNIGLMVYMNIDLLAVRNHAKGNESGLYSSVLLFGRIIYYFSTTLGTILLPAAADKELNEREKIKTLNRTLLMMVTFSFMCMVPINIWKNFFIKLLYGPEYLNAAPFVIYVSIISVALSINTILVNYLVGIGKTKFPTIVMILMDMLIIVFSVFTMDINHILGGIGIIGFVGAVIIYLFGGCKSVDKVISTEGTKR